MLLTEVKVVCSVISSGDVVNRTSPEDDGTETKDVAEVEISSPLVPILGVVNMTIDELGVEDITEDVDDMAVDVTMVRGVI